MRNELERRRLGIGTFGGGKRLTMTNLKISPLHHTHRKAVAKEETYNLFIEEKLQDLADDVSRSCRRHQKVDKAQNIVFRKHFEIQ
ncbi:unnamed protein product [Strongylus vulgaris]|uniref:Uncharacterized protein n=1 Tax=Strongylus vulgaris TaxID=40348 RepID=A0A3P7J2N1_STRVU|nr:unnamed protein product [Strongylus vulgaris]